jgi:hypothetical protein
MVYVALGIAYGMLVAAIAGRYSHALPQIDRNRRTLARYAPIVLIAPLFIFAIPVVVLGALVLLLTRIEGFDRVLSSPRALMIGRLAALAVVAVALPGFVAGILEIASG